MKKIFKALAISAASVAMVAGIATATACSAGYNGEYEGGYSYTNGYGATYGMMVKVTVENNIITKVTDITNTEDSLKKQAGYEKSWDGTKNVYEYKTEGVEWHEVSDGWTNYFKSSISYGSSWLLFSYKKDTTTQKYPEAFDDATLVNKKGTPEGTFTDNKQYYKYKDEKGKVDATKFVEWDGNFIPDEDQANGKYGWTDSNEKTWTDHAAWLLQQYVGWSVADVLDISVYTNYGYSLAANSNTQFVPDNSKSGEPYEKGYNDSLASSGLLVTGSTQGSGRLLLAVQNALLGK